MEKEKISRRIEGIEPPIDTNYIKSVMAVKFSRDIADCIPEIDDTTFSDEFKNDEFESKLYENLEEAGFLKQDEYGDYYGTGPLKKYGSYLNDFVYEITQAVEKLYIDADESCSILKSETKFDQLSLGIEVEKQKKLESLPVDRHLWYKGRIFLEEMKFAELPESIQNHAKHQIITCDTNDDSPDGAVMGVSNYVFPNGYSDPKRLLFIFTADSTFADKYPDGKRSEEKRIAFKDLPEKIREAIMEDVLKADGDRIYSQLNFSEYLSDAELKALFNKEAKEKENTVEKAQEKPEKKKHKYRGR